MFYITEDTMQLKIKKRVEKHGDEEVNAYDAMLSGDFPNAVLLKLDENLRGVFYAPDRQQDIEQDFYPNLRFPKIGTIAWDLEMSRMTLTCHDREFPERNVYLDGKELKDVKFHMKEGGTVTLSFRVVLGQVDEEDLLRLLRLDNHRIPITIYQAAEEEKPDNFEQADLLGSDPATHSDARKDAEKLFSNPVGAQSPEELLGLEPEAPPA